MRTFDSNIEGHEGLCVATWVNTCGTDCRGVMGFFVPVKSVWWWPVVIKTGPVFAGIITSNLTIINVGSNND